MQGRSANPVSPKEAAEVDTCLCRWDPGFFSMVASFSRVFDEGCTTIRNSGLGSRNSSPSSEFRIPIPNIIRYTCKKMASAVFEDLVGQQTAMQTLQNALSSGRIAHAFLFAGPRGVGKTTCPYSGQVAQLPILFRACDQTVQRLLRAWTSPIRVPRCPRD